MIGAGGEHPVQLPTQLRDLLPDLDAASISIPDKIESLAVTADGTVYIATDNDGLTDGSVFAVTGSLRPMNNTFVLDPGLASPFPDANDLNFGGSGSLCVASATARKKAAARAGSSTAASPAKSGVNRHSPVDVAAASFEFADQHDR